MEWSVREKIHRYLFIDYGLVREALAEFVGTTFLIALGDAGVAQSILSRSSKGDYLSINFGWVFAVAFAVYISGGVSDALQAYDGGIRSISGQNATAAIFATYPEDFLTLQGGLADQIFGTSILVLCIMAIGDSENMDVPKALVPLLTGFSVGLVGIAYGYRNYQWFWVPILGPYIGAAIGALIYQLTIGFHWPKFSAKNSSYDTSMEMNLSVISRPVPTSSKRISTADSGNDTDTSICSDVTSKLENVRGSKNQQLREEKEKIIVQTATIIM